MNWVERRQRTHPVQCHVCAFFAWTLGFGAAIWLTTGSLGMIGTAVKNLLGG